VPVLPAAVLSVTSVPVGTGSVVVYVSVQGQFVMVRVAGCMRQLACSVVRGRGNYACSNIGGVSLSKSRGGWAVGCVCCDSCGGQVSCWGSR